jgi:hypothetical protein
MTNAYIIHDLIAQLQSQSDLLYPPIITPHAQVAINCLVDMVNSLPTDSPVLSYIIANHLNPVDVLATMVDGKISLLQQPRLFPEGFTLEGITRDSGVYIWNHLLTESNSYIGSAANSFKRIDQHIDQFAGVRPMFKVHRFALTNGGVHSFS